MDTEEKVKIKFKTIRKKRPLRKRRHSEEGEGDIKEEIAVDLKETLEMQRLRKRAPGLNSVCLNSGMKLGKEALIISDPFKIKSGGLLDLKEARQAQKQLGESESSDSLGVLPDSVGTQFSKETRIRDEDEEMRKFIESEMSRRMGKGEKDGSGSSEAEKDGNKFLTPEDKALLSLPEHLSKSTFRKNEEMLSSQMLSGIPEVDLGIDEKIRNIEATELAKKKTAEELAKNKSKKPSDFVPTNLNVNFRLPNRFKTDIAEETLKKGDASSTTAATTIERTVVVGQLPEERIVPLVPDRRGQDPNRATDDLHLTNFKKQFQRK